MVLKRVAAIGVIAAVITLSGCSAIQGTVNSFVEKVSEPKIGQCWDGTIDDVYYGGPDTSRAVPCSGKHTVITAAVKNLPAGEPASWADPDNPGYVSQRLLDDEYYVCGYLEDGFVPDVGFGDSRVIVGYHLPTLAQWRAGARWVRCDVAVIALASHIGSQTLAQLPKTVADIHKQETADPRAHETCIVGSLLPSEETDPLHDTQAEYVDCRTPTAWSQSLFIQLPKTTDGSTPTTSELQSQSKRVCDQAAIDQGHIVVPYGPSTVQWARGYRGLVCWIADDPI